MSLTQDLADLNAQLREKIPPETQALMQRAQEELTASNLAAHAKKAGDKAPPFSLPSARGEMVASTDLLQQGPLVISFYRGGWCPYCNLELRALQGILPELHALGARLVAISPQLPDESLSTAQKHELAFDVLSDVGSKVARAFGLTYALPAEVVDLYETFGIDLKKVNGEDGHTLPLAATYLIDTDGTILHAFVDVDYTKRQDPEEILSILEAHHSARSA